MTPLVSCVFPVSPFARCFAANFFHWTIVALPMVCILLLSITLSGIASAQVVYPFDVPEKIDAELVVNTNSKTSVNRSLFGLNCNWPEGQYGKVGYNHPDAQ